MESLKEQITAQLNQGESIVTDLKSRAKEALSGMEMPGINDEYWKYTKISNHLKRKFDSSNVIAVTDVSPFIIPGLKGSIAVVVNGEYNAALSAITPEDGLTITSLNEAIRTDKALNYYGKCADYKAEVFIGLNTAFHQNGVFIHAAKGKVIEQTIMVLNIISTEKGFIQSRNLFVAEPSSQLRITELFVSQKGASGVNNSLAELVIRENASMDYVKAQDYNLACDHIATEGVKQAKDSRFHIDTITLGGNLVRNNLNIDMDGVNVYTELNGLFVGEGNQHLDNHTRVDHKKENGESHEMYKGVLGGKSTGVFNGKVFVHQYAQKTNGFQSNANILLSDDAKINTKPELEIYADDVKCSHGTTTGQMDEEALFYLRARGIGKESAQRLVLSAFAGEVIEKINDKVVGAYIQEKFESKLARI